MQCHSHGETVDVITCLWIRARIPLHTKKTNNHDHAIDGESEDSREMTVRAKWQTCTRHDSFV